MKTKFIIIISVIAGLVGAVALFRLSKNSSQKSMLTIGILQTASHPALDAVRNGFTQTIKNTLSDNVTLTVQNAEGSILNAHAIAHHFRANNEFNLFFAIATPALQALAMEETERPIVFSAVTNPSALGIHEHERNITGISDHIDIKKEIDALKLLLPHTNTVGVLFNPSEINSASLAQEMVEYLEKIGLIPIKVGISSEAEISTATSSALRKVDVLLAPTDNMVASAISLIAQEAEKAKKPLIVSDNLLVKHGALMSRGVDYEAIGKQAAEVAIDIIQNKRTAKDVSFATPEIDTVVINTTVLKQLDLTIPDDLKRSPDKYIFVE